jgi:TRAP-type C4-dicarboxylate transport system substrate-binding protein
MTRLTATPSTLRSSARRIRTVSSLVAVPLLVASCSLGEGSGATGESLADMEPVVLTFSVPDSPTSQLGVGTKSFIEFATEKSGGKIKFEPYYSGSLLTWKEGLNGAKTGVADIAFMSTSHFPQELPVSNWLTGVGQLQDPNVALGTIQGALAADETFRDTPELVGEFKAHDIHILNAFNSPPYGMLCTKPVDSLESAAGKRVRAGGDLWVKELTSLGMEPSFVDGSEQYEALQRGVLDCTVNTAGLLADQSMWEIAKEYTPISLSPFLGGINGINLDTWNSLPDQAKRILEEASIEYLIAWARQGMTLEAKWGNEGAGKHGVSFNDPRELDETLARHQQKALAALPAAAPSAVKDAQAIIDRHTESLAYWREELMSVGIEPVKSGPDAILEAYQNLADDTIDWAAVLIAAKERILSDQ